VKEKGQCLKVDQAKNKKGKKIRAKRNGVRVVRMRRSREEEEEEGKNK